MLIFGGGGEGARAGGEMCRGRVKHLFCKVGSCLAESSAPHSRYGVTPARGSAECPAAQGRAGSTFAVILSQAKRCGVFLGTGIASKALRSRGGGEKGRRVVCVWKGIIRIITTTIITKEET